MHTHSIEKPWAVRNVWHFCCQCACTLECDIFRSPSHPSMHEFSRNLTVRTAHRVRDVRAYQIKRTTWFLLSVQHIVKMWSFPHKHTLHIPIRGKIFCKTQMEKRSRNSYGSLGMAEICSTELKFISLETARGKLDLQRTVDSHMPFVSISKLFLS